MRIKTLTEYKIELLIKELEKLYNLAANMSSYHPPAKNPEKIFYDFTMAHIEICKLIVNLKEEE